MARTEQRLKNNYTYPNKVELIRAGKKYFDTMVSLIESATAFVHLQTYILEADETGHRVGEALKDAATRGVRVYVVVDGYASQNLPKSFVKSLENAGVRFKFFEPLFRSSKFYFGRRLHHKILVVDDTYSMVSGMNIADRYNDIHEKKAWLDFAVLVEGGISAQLAVLCWKTWNGYLPTGKKIRLLKKNFQFDIPEEEKCLVSMRRNDWVKNKNQISKSYLELFRDAEKEIVILCSYFIPGTAIRRSLRKSAQRGVRIRVIMTGMSDVTIAKNAERYLYAWLLRNNIDIYEYQTNVLHGKVAVSDKKWVTIGSYNINDISAFASVELNLNIRNEKFASLVYDNLQDIIENHCLHINVDAKLSRMGAYKKFISWCSYLFVRFVFYLFTFYFKQQK